MLDDGTKQLSIFDPVQEEATTAMAGGAQTDVNSMAPELAGTVLTEAEDVEDTEEIVVASHKRRKKRTLEELCANLPVEEHIVDLPEAEQVNHNGTPLVCIGRE